MESNSLHPKAKEVCAQLVSVCKAMSNAVEQRCTEETLVEHIRAVAVSALNVSSTITAHIESRDPEMREKAELQENFLADYTKLLRETIVALVRHTRDFYANSLDYMTQQALSNSQKEVAHHVKSLLEASRGTSSSRLLRSRLCFALSSPTIPSAECTSPFSYVSLLVLLFAEFRSAIVLHSALYVVFWASHITHQVLTLLFA